MQSHEHHAPRLGAVLGLVTGLLALASIGSTPTHAGAQSFRIDDPGTVIFDTTNRNCIVLTTSADHGDVTFDSSVSVTAFDGVPVDHTLGSYGLELATVGFGAAPNTVPRGMVRGTPSLTGTITVEVTATDDKGTPTTGDDETASVSFDIDMIGAAEASYTIGAGRLDRGYTIDCWDTGQETNGFIRQLDNFGPSGRALAAHGVVVRNYTPWDGVSTGEPIDAAYLDGLDVLLDGWVGDGGWSATELDLIHDWVTGEGTYAGVPGHRGVLIAAEDRGDADGLGERFGVTTTSPSGPCTHVPYEVEPTPPPCPDMTAVATSHPIVHGPFGDWGDDVLTGSGSIGWFVDHPGWTVIAENPSGHATVITRAFGSGRVILLADEGLLRTQSFGPDFANDVFVGNLLAYALGLSDHPILVGDTVAGTVGTTMSVDLCANDDSLGEPTSSISVIGPVPPGLSLVGCTIRGVPTTAGVLTGAYRVTDGNGVSATASIRFSIGEAPATPVVARCQGRKATLVGTAGDDVLRGTGGDDVIVALGGDDTVRGFGGDDVICAGGGDDTVIGGRGDDLVLAGTGNDRVLGQGGRDRLLGNGGADELVGGKGSDVVSGGRGRPDRCVGGPGSDRRGSGCERVAGLERRRVPAPRRRAGG